MAKQGEIDYLKNIGEAGVRHAINKPFSDADCDRFLMELGAVMSLLPPPPARLLDLGCGTGWTSVIFAKRGYDVVGVDIAADMIRHARESRDAGVLDNLRFEVSDYEDLRFSGEFDCAVFFDALHHAVDEGLAIRKAYEALKPGGICVAYEPGKGHQDAEASREAVRKWDVTEKDMHPDKVIALARQAGFRDCKAYPHAYDMQRILRVCFDSAEWAPLDPAEAPPRRARIAERLRLATVPLESAAATRLRYSNCLSAFMHVLANVGNSGVVQLIK